MVGDSKYNIFTRNFDSLTPLAPKFPNFAVQILLFRMKHCCRRHTCTCATKFLHHLGYGVLLAKNNVQDQNWRGAWLGEHPKILDPLRFSATVEANNFKFGTQIGFGASLPKTTFWTKIGGGLGQGSSQEKFGTPYVLLQPLKPATSNLVHKFGLALAYPKTFRTKICGGLGQGSIQKSWDPLPIFATVEASD